MVLAAGHTVDNVLKDGLALYVIFQIDDGVKDLLNAVPIAIVSPKGKNKEYVQILMRENQPDCKASFLVGLSYMGWFVLSFFVCLLSWMTA